jgi:hypothetical protein
MTKFALAVIALGTLTTGCINMGTKRPTAGGGPIARTAPQGDHMDPLSDTHATFERRADLGER